MINKEKKSIFGQNKKVEKQGQFQQENVNVQNQNQQQFQQQNIQQNQNENVFDEIKLNGQEVHDENIEQEFIDEHEQMIDENLEHIDEQHEFSEQELLDRIAVLEHELNEKNIKIVSLEKQVEALNNSFKTELVKKANEAQIKLQEKIKEYQQKYEIELKNAKKFALRDKAIDLINIINNFENALKTPSTNPEVQNYVKGFMMFSNMFKNYLENNNIIEISVKPNDEFNAKTMEAFDTEKHPNIKPNHVIKIIKKGYKLFDIVIVPVLVVVAK